MDGHQFSLLPSIYFSKQGTHCIHRILILISRFAVIAACQLVYDYNVTAEWCEAETRMMIAESLLLFLLSGPSGSSGGDTLLQQVNQLATEAAPSTSTGIFGQLTGLSVWPQLV